MNESTNESGWIHEDSGAITIQYARKGNEL